MEENKENVNQTNNQEVQNEQPQKMLIKIKHLITCKHKAKEHKIQ